MKIAREGVQLSYEITGKGDRNFVLIHSTGGNHQFMEAQAQYLAQFGRVLNMDLRGHGESDKPKQEYTIEEFAKDILFLCRENGIQRAIVVGLLLGGSISIELANIAPELVSHQVLLDPASLLGRYEIQLLQDYIEDLRNPKEENFVESLTDSMFFSTTESNKQLALKALKMTTKQAFASSFENLLKWNKTCQAKIIRCKMPTLLVESSEPLCSESAFREFCPHVVSGKVVGSGHWATLEVPEQLNLMINRFLMIYS
ncbi:MAG: alpha/beta hydrolase [Gammaproteobacteria bacterium]